VFELLAIELQRSGHVGVLPAGVVVTGGSSLLPGMLEVAERALGMPARRGLPRDVGGLTDVVASPVYATGVGLVKFGLENFSSQGPYGTQQLGIYQRLREKMSGWFELAF
jgi:cell division protein FtsA